MESYTLPTWTFEIKLIDDKVSVVLSSTGEHVRTYAIRPLRFQGPQYNFMNYLLLHPDTDIARGTVTSDIEGCKNIKDLTELVRFCGFSKELKNHFFPLCKSTKIRFTNPVVLEHKVTGRLAKHLVNIEK